MRETDGMEIEGRVMLALRDVGRSLDGGRAAKAAEQNIAIGWSIQGDDSAGWKKPRSLGPLHGGARSRKRGKPYRIWHSAT